jgi:molecular chaperone DnaJ
MDFYVILGLAPTASLPEVKRAYRRLARRYHPDINPGDHEAAERFKEILSAYETLSDPDRRRRYDQVGFQMEIDAGPAIGFEGFDFSAGVHANQQSTFGDLFADVLQRERARSARPERGADLHVTVAIDLEQAVAGAEAPLTITRQERCASCQGRGTRAAPGSECVQCQGSGVLRSARGHMVFARPCPRCDGSGVERQQRCVPCHGTGVGVRTETVPVRLPAGVADGVRLRLAERGHAGARGGPHGDVYVTVQVRPHPRFRREGDDLFVEVPVASHEAALGARVEVAGIDGPARVRIPPGTQSGQRFRLRGRGAPSMRTGQRGDLVVEARVVLPPVLDERSKELLREFGRINGESVRR